MTGPHKLVASALARTVHLDELAALRREGLDQRPRSIGQPRALEAIRLGLSIDAPGYHVFVSGPAGTGKMSTVLSLLREGLRPKGPLRDLMFVENFEDPDHPLCIEMPAGEGRLFRRALLDFSKDLPEHLSRALEDEELSRRHQRGTRDLETQESDALAAFEQRLAAEQFALIHLQIDQSEQLDIQPIIDGEPVDLDSLGRAGEGAQEGAAALDEAQRAALRERHDAFKAELQQIVNQLRRAAMRFRRELKAHERAVIRAQLQELCDELVQRFTYEGVEAWLGALADWLTEQASQFGEHFDEDDLETLRQRLTVNLVLDNTHQEEAPIIVEHTASFANLFGTIERPAGEARATLNVSDIKAGSLLKADRGVLVLMAEDAVQSEGVWRTLIRTLRTNQLVIQSPEQVLSPAGGGALKPAAIEIDVRVITLGHDMLYQLLHESSNDFSRVFKIKAQFEGHLPDSLETLALYTAHVERVVGEEQLLPLSDEALARFCEYGAYIGGRRGYFSARFSVLTDLLREAAHYGLSEGAERMGPEHIERAIRERERRHSLPEERLRMLITQGVLDISTEGRLVGVVNALTLLDLGDHRFGQPCRVSATVAPGHEGLISVEREVELSGRIHDKGTLILAGYLRHFYLPDRPLSLSATLSFEQLHDELDGDSASAAEALALISVLADVPLEQGIAITGALNQRGQVMAVGGVAEKVLGFFELCVARGLTGQQGVVLPAENARTLLLPARILRAIEAGEFHLWAVSHLNEVIELFTGQAAGQLDEAGHFPPESVNHHARVRLIELFNQSRPPKRGY